MEKGDVLVEFTVQDGKEERDAHDSEKHLKACLKEQLSNTNWKFMIQGISYKMGILSGRMRGTESEDSILKNYIL